MTEGQRTGRRPGNPDTRGQVLDAARAAFLRLGFNDTTIRGIARDANVDPALIHRWFGDKRGLLLATIEARFDPMQVIEAVVGHGPERLGTRIAHAALTVWDSPMGTVWLDAVRRTPGMLPVMVGFLNEPLVSAGKRMLGIPDAEAKLRVVVLQSIMVGFITTRFLARLEPLASLPKEDVARVMAPLLERAIAGDLGVGGARGRRPEKSSPPSPA